MTFPAHILKRLVGSCVIAVLALHPSLLVSRQNASPSPRIIEILADHDSRYKMAGLKQPEIVVRAGEPVTLRITAKKAKNRNRDGAIHGFTLLRAGDEKAIPDWDFELMPGTQEFTVTPPKEPGDYIVVCTVICSENHEGMHMKVVVVP